MLSATARRWAFFALALVWSGTAQAQPREVVAQPSTPPAGAAQVEPPKDPLGRTTPRGTVLGFLSYGRKGEDGLGSQFLDTPLKGAAAGDLAHQLFVVLDARLYARLTQLSDSPEGSRANPLELDRDVVGTVTGATGDVSIVVERVDRGQAGRLWLFSRDTLDAIPALYEEIVETRQGSLWHRMVTGTRLEGAWLVEWLSVLLGLVTLYLATVLVNRALAAGIRPVWRRLFKKTDPPRETLPVPVRLLVVVWLGRKLFALMALPIFVRQIWSNAATVVTAASIVWILILVNGEIEQYIRGRFHPTGAGAKTSLLRLARRAADALVIFGGLLAVLRLFAVDPTPALAGLGVGGIAVALAAQRTLENVIAGASLVFDQAVRVGDALKVGDVRGTVDEIGLRSTRIRTLDRTIVSIPNGQIANATLETLSVRDKFWFNHTVSLRYGTTSDQLRFVIDGIRRSLYAQSFVEAETVRVRFLRLGAFSLDVDVFAYFLARDWPHFLELQEEMLFAVTGIVERSGTALAIPSQMTYLKGASQGVPAGLTPEP